MKEKNYGIELVRIIAMLMILTLHCNLFSTKVVWSTDIKNIFFTTTEFISIIAVNVYVFISGYFLTKHKFDIRKLIKLELIVIFYSVLVYVLLVLTNYTVFDKKVFVTLFFPIINTNYWFYTCYAVLFFMMPVLKKVYLYLKKENKIKTVLIILIVIMSLLPSINPGNNRLTIDSGYNYAWFVTLVLIGAYLKDYPIKLKTWKLLLCYLGVLSTQLILYYYIWKVTNIPWIPFWHKFLYSYNNILVLTSSILFFSLVTRINVKNKVLINIINFFSVSTFSVYLIHTHPYAINTILPNLLDISIYRSSNMIYLYYFGWIFGLFVFCILVDKIRMLFFSLVGKICKFNKINKRLDSINKKIEIEV